MLVGLTYDLRSEYLAMGYGEEETAEFDRDDTIDAIEDALRLLGHETRRVGHVRSLAQALAAGERWDFVFNIAEGLKGIGREAQVPALLEAYGIPYTFSDPLVMSLTLHKGMTKRVIRDAGLPTPDFAVIQSPGDIAAVNFPPPWFVKPVAEGTGKGINESSRVESHAELESLCREMLPLFPDGLLAEEYLPGREFTIGILGTGQKARAVATMEVILLAEAEKGCYSYKNKEYCEQFVEYRLGHAAEDIQVAEAEDVALAAWRVLGCRDGGRVDLRCDADGAPSFMEVNPLAGLHPAHSDLPILCDKSGMSYVELIGEIVESAMERIKV